MSRYTMVAYLSLFFEKNYFMHLRIKPLILSHIVTAIEGIK